MGKLADLNIPVREGNLRNPERLNQSLKDVGQKAEPWKRLATEGFGQILFGDEGTIPWYMSFAPGADLTDKLMEGRQPGLLDIPGPGTLAKIAMLPIMKLGAKEILEGTARMGKNARNLDKAKNPIIERWHRTRSINDANIRDKGLLVGKDNPNYGKNTGDEDRLKIPAAWLGTSPSEVPVLQYYFMNKPNEVSTYRVRIPKEEYYSTPRLKWDSGYRGDASDARIVAKGESSLTGEVGRRTGRESLIDLFGKSIPPQYLEQIPRTEIDKMKAHSDMLENYRAEFGSPNQTLSEIGNDIVKNEMDDWMPASERFHMYRYDVPKLRDIQSGNRPDELLANANRAYKDQTHGIPKYGSLALSGEMPERFDTHWQYHPKESMSIGNPEAVATGHVSRGNSISPYALEKDVKAWNPKQRVMKWNDYNYYVNSGETPALAMFHTRPSKVLVDTPEGLKTNTISDNSDVFGGHISRGNIPNSYKTKPSELLKELKDEGVSSDERAQRLRELMSLRSNVEGLYW